MKRSNMEREAIESNLMVVCGMVARVFGNQYRIRFCELTPEMLNEHFSPGERRDFDLDERSEVVCIWGYYGKKLIHVINTSGLGVLGICAAVLERMAEEEECW